MSALFGKGKAKSKRIGKESLTHVDQQPNATVVQNNEPVFVADSPSGAAKTDPAVLIGLAMAFGRQRGSAAVPNVVLAPLSAAAEAGCGASQMVVGFLNRRASKANTKTNAFVIGAGQGLHSIPADRKDWAVYDGGKAHV